MTAQIRPGTLLSILCAGCLLVASNCKAEMLVSQNLGLAAYSASNQWLDNSPDRAFDGLGTTLWNAGSFATEWIEVDLQRTYLLSRIDLIIQQTPDSNTIHELWVSDNDIQNDVSGATLIHTFSGFTVNGQFLSVTLPTSVSARHLQVRTTSSASWVAWTEVQAFGVIPEPSTFVFVLLGGFGACFFVRVR